MLISRHVWIALFNETAAVALLMAGLGSWRAILAFLVAHGMAVYFANLFFAAAAITHKETRRVIGRSFFAPILVLSCLPLVGPPGIIMFTLMMLLYPVRALAEEEYEKVDSDLFENLASESDMLLVFKANPVYAIHNRLTAEQELAILRTLERLDWFPFKTRLLQIYLEHSRHTSVVLEAGRIITRKRDSLLKRIAEFEALGSEGDPVTLASLYHEIYHLALWGPLIGDTYLRRACRIINDAARERPGDPAVLMHAVLYNMKSGHYDLARDFLKEARQCVDPRSREAHTLTRYECELRTVRRIEQGQINFLTEGFKL